MGLILLAKYHRSTDLSSTTLFPPHNFLMHGTDILAMNEPDTDNFTKIDVKLLTLPSLIIIAMVPQLPLYSNDSILHFILR